MKDTIRQIRIVITSVVATVCIVLVVPGVQAASDGGCTCATTCCTGINGQTLNYSEGGLDGYSASISCSASPMTEAGSNYCVYNLGVTGTNGSSVQQMLTSRTISLSIADRNAP